MYIKMMGAVFVIVGCGGYGILKAMAHRREVNALHQLIQAMDAMICELEYRLTPLPELCRFGAAQVTGPVCSLLKSLGKTLDEQVSPDVGLCTIAALKETPAIPGYAANQILALGQTLGRFDLPGQLTSLERCKQSCMGQLEILEHQQSQRLRGYQTLGFCAGVALAILLF